MEPLPLFGPDDTVRRVSLVRLASEVARSLSAVGRFAVEGEVVRPARHPGGTYFVLKDRAAQVSVRCPASRAARCRVVAGERVLVTGSLTWLSDRGQVQLVAEEVVPVGEGAIAALLEERRARLRAEGLLDRPRRPLPLLPAVIGVVCGRDAAVRADIESVVAQRFPGYPVLFAETAVSGPGAADAVVDALRALDARPEVEVIILARGGGDATQLLPFSDEDLCRAICATRAPVVSAIGHDGDRPLCDDVADRRCGTPSLAAAAVVPDRRALQDELDAYLTSAARHLARGRQQALLDLSRAAPGALLDLLEQRRARAARDLAALHPAAALRAGLSVARAGCGRAADNLALVHPRRLLAPAHARLESTRSHLEALDPARVLERGYAVVRDGRGRVLRDSTGLAPGDRLDVQLARGRVRATVDEGGGPG